MALRNTLNTQIWRQWGKHSHRQRESQPARHNTLAYLIYCAICTNVRKVRFRLISGFNLAKQTITNTTAKLYFYLPNSNQIYVYIVNFHRTAQIMDETEKCKRGTKFVAFSFLETKSPRQNWRCVIGASTVGGGQRQPVSLGRWPFSGSLAAAIGDVWYDGLIHGLPVAHNMYSLESFTQHPLSDQLHSSIELFDENNQRNRLQTTKT